MTTNANECRECAFAQASYRKGSQDFPTCLAHRTTNATPGVELSDWMLQRIADADVRNWTALPSDFEAAAVAKVYVQINRHFGKREIRQRIAASKATTFQELREAITGGTNA